MSELIMKVDGMTCQGCVKSVSGVLSGMAGVARDVTLSPGALAGALLAWICLPLFFASVAFSRRQV